MDNDYKDWEKEWEEDHTLAVKRSMDEVDKVWKITESLGQVEDGDRFAIKTGYKAFDEATGGFESKRTYIIGGLKKSGKSTLVMNFLAEMLAEGVKIGVLDTELDEQDYISRMVAISNFIHEYDEANNEKLKQSWRTVFLDNGQFNYCAEADVLNQGKYDISKTLHQFELWRLKGVQVFVLDNVTTIQNQLVENRAGYELLREFIGQLIRYAKNKNIILILVLHTKDANLMVKEHMEKISKIIEHKNPSEMFESTVVVNTRPSSSDLYGGGGIRSQISGGALLLWRPFQDFRDKSFQRVALLILEDWRSKRKTFVNEIELDFEEDKSHYYEVKKEVK